MNRILDGMRVVEGSAFVAAPLAGMTLAQMGADVIRFDRLQGGLDAERWPITKSGKSLFWAGLNQGKRSLAVDMTTPQGREILTRLICRPGEDAGIFLTNLRLRGWMSYEGLKQHREDLIMMAVLGDRHGGPQVDYTVNPAVGFPTATGPEGSTEPVGHALPAWDCITGQQAAMAIIAADRHRRKTGKGQLIELALKDTALAMLGNLGIIAEASINGSDRPKMGNSLFGAYAQDFVCQDGQRVMVVALTDRQWRNLKAATGTEAEMADLSQRLNADLDQEGERFIHRHAITALLKPFFEARTFSDVATSLAGSDVTWSQYRTFKQAVEEDPDCSLDNPMFAMLNQPGIGSYLMPGSPIHFMGVDRLAPAPAPILGEHTLEILTEIGFSNTEIASLHDTKIVASPK